MCAFPQAVRAAHYRQVVSAAGRARRKEMCELRRRAEARRDGAAAIRAEIVRERQAAARWAAFRVQIFNFVF